MASEQHLDLGLDQDLKQRVANEFVDEGGLFGAVRQAQLTPDEILALAQAGWIQRDYHDAPVMEAPQATIDWWGLKHQHRDRALHAISHRLEDGAPWIGTRQEILEELIASNWEEQEDELRTLLHAFAYASMWNQETTPETTAIETQETFFFYTDRMRTTAVTASQYATDPPDADHPFWDMVSALTEVRE